MLLETMFSQHIYVTTHDISLWKYLLNLFAEGVGKNEERGGEIRFQN